MGLNEMTKEVTEYLDEAYAALKNAVREADKTGKAFDFSVAYGMGGRYYPKKHKMTRTEALNHLRGGLTLSDEKRLEIARVLDEDEDDSYNDEEGWVSSSQSC